MQNNKKKIKKVFKVNKALLKSLATHRKEQLTKMLNYEPITILNIYTNYSSELPSNENTSFPPHHVE